MSDEKNKIELSENKRYLRCFVIIYVGMGMALLGGLELFFTGLPEHFITSIGLILIGVGVISLRLTKEE